MNPYIPPVITPVKKPSIAPPTKAPFISAATTTIPLVPPVGTVSIANMAITPTLILIIVHLAFDKHPLGSIILIGLF